MVFRALIAHGYSHHVWGSEKVALATAEAYRQLGGEVRFVLPGGGPFADSVRQAGFRIHDVNTLIPSLRRPGRAVLRPLRLLGPLVGWKPDLLHATSLGPVPALLPAARLLRIPLVAQLQTVYGQDEMRRRLTGHADILLPVSEAAARSCRSFLRKAGHSRPNMSLLFPPVEGPSADQVEVAAELRDRWGVIPGDVVVGMVGQIIPRKGVDTFVQAVARIPDRPGRRIIPVLVGDAPRGQESYLAEIQNLLRETGLADKAIRTGFVQDTPSHLAAMDILAMPSREEGFGLVAGEAQRARAVPVAARVGGLPHLIEEGRTGLLVEPDDPCQLAEALLSLVEDPVRRSRWAERGARRIGQLYSHEAYRIGLATATGLAPQVESHSLQAGMVSSWD